MIENYINNLNFDQGLNYINNLNFDQGLTIVLVSSIISHFLAGFFFNGVHNYGVIIIGGSLHTALWVPLVLYFIGFGTVRFQICQDIYNFVFYFEYINPFFDKLFIIIERFTGKNPVPFYIKTEESLRLIEQCVFWMNEYDRLIIKRLENENRLLERDLKSYKAISEKHPRVAEYQRRLLYQKDYLKKQYIIYCEIEEAFAYALEKKKNLRAAGIKHSRDGTLKRGSKWRYTFGAFNVRSLEEQKPGYVLG